MSEIVTPANRCRLVLVLDGQQIEALDKAVAGGAAECLSAALSGGDVASLILAPGTLDEERFAPLAAPLVALAQEAGVAAIIAGFTRTAGRLGADGVQFGQNPEAIGEAVEQFHPKLMVGAASVKSRHTALVLGELGPDYLMFGKPGGDTHPQANPKNIALGEWWATMVELPAIVMAGCELDSIVEVAATGCDFVGLSRAVFGDDSATFTGDRPVDPAACRTAVARANELLDAHAPRFDDVT